MIIVAVAQPKSTEIGSICCGMFCGVIHSWWLALIYAEFSG
ncbi:hypothetical membrane protein [Renibacterium salmoninarum ATCC 33209]|uniref:Hypothetical membrane protein n=1 Tax=Renibacterium salmoninarum (strain ATCC 33209 / DSM 20767 / JCM 11484 / NBRC 15589 / NCIMB 2235) TaxID=288705 RepID=A9WNJ9_RENSM|nr:hypothetical membrane protein [Renibacterium salmoninarum ATCC 33209]